MDANKLKVLKEIGYEFRETCATCAHATFPHDDFGTCGKHCYKHAKHTGEPRQLSINKNGWCPSYERGSFEKFFTYLDD